MAYSKYGWVTMDTPKGSCQCGFIDRYIFYF